VVARDDEDVRRGLGVEVTERDRSVVLVDHLGRHLTGHDPAEEALGLGAAPVARRGLVGHAVERIGASTG
jgi:hypothetical protein